MRDIGKHPFMDYVVMIGRILLFGSMLAVIPMAIWARDHGFYLLLVGWFGYGLGRLKGDIFVATFGGKP